VQRPPKNSAAPKAAGTSLRAQAVRLLARREYSRAELEARLVAKGASRDDIAVVLDELSALGYVSNERFARAFAEQKAGRLSRHRIASDLKARGVDGDDIAAALATAGVEDASTIEALWQRRFGTSPANDREKARQVRFLQSRGFSLSAIFTLLRKVASRTSA
jgi:regulatory protein